ncbi:DAZ-associated protein 2 isoform X2 [Bemisia tabaci]|uniref:DAZ-associated protein 2 isoform X2 n=1 Tax=Bemisia tabaci TaxID=7038 RepID=UPI0008F9CFAD|nr:PREDICTED: DAZ-associated protein 2-like isoform X2 [Bemisia tabaci]
MADKKVPAYPGTPQGPPTAGYVPAGPHNPTAGYPVSSVPVSTPYGVIANGQLYTTPQVPQVPPGYDQAVLNQALLQQQQQQQQLYSPQSALAAAAMAQLYAAQGMHPYVNYASIPGYAQIAAHPQSSAAAYYPGLTYAYPHQLRPTIILPNGYDPGARFDGIGQPVIPPTPPGVAPNAAQLAAMAAGQHVALTQILHERRE